MLLSCSLVLGRKCWDLKPFLLVLIGVALEDPRYRVRLFHLLLASIFS